MGFGSGGLWTGITFATLGRWPGQEYLCMSRVFAAYSVGGLLGPAIGAIHPTNAGLPSGSARPRIATPGK